MFGQVASRFSKLTATQQSEIEIDFEQGLLHHNPTVFDPIHHDDDAAGVGIGFVIDDGNRNDYRLLQSTLDTICAQPSTAAIGTLHLDRGYDYISLPDGLDGYPIRHRTVIPRNQPGQGRIPLVGFQRRWIVERTNAWLTNFRQLKINWDRTTEHRHAAVNLLFAITCIYKLVDHLTANDLPLKTIRRVS